MKEKEEYKKVLDDEIHQINLYVDRSAPGSGKTTEIANFIKNHPKLTFGIIAYNHDILEEYEKLLPNKSYVHWWGKEHFCPFKGLLNSGLAFNRVCALGYKLERPECKGCKYHKQFRKKAQTYLLVTPYLGTKQASKIKFDLLFNEEDILKFEKKLYPPIEELVKAQLEIFERSDRYKYIPKYKKLTTREAYINCAADIERSIEDYCEKLIIEEILAKRDIKKEFDCKPKIKWLKQQTPNEIRLWYLYKYDLFSESDTEVFELPYIYFIFDQCLKSTTQKLLNADATADLEMLRSVSLHYKFAKIVIEKTILRINIEEKPISSLGGLGKFIDKNNNHRELKASKIVRLGFPNWYPRNKVRKPEVFTDIVSKIAELSMLHDLDTIPILCTKESNKEEKLKKSLKEKLRYDEHDRKIEIITYGRERTVNTFKDYSVIFLVGTPTPNYEELKKKVETKYPLVKKTRKSYGKKHKEEGDAWSFIEYDEFSTKLNQLLKKDQDDTIYQSAHRARPLNKPTTIYAFCWIPNELKEELSYVELTDKDYPNYILPMQIKKGLKVKDSKKLITDYLILLKGGGFREVPQIEIVNWCKWKGIGRDKTLNFLKEIVKENSKIVRYLPISSKKKGWVIYFI